MAVQPAVQIPVSGTLVTSQPTQIERWAFALLLITLGFVLIFCGLGVWEFLWKIEPALPKLTGSTSIEVQAAVDQHKLIAEELRAPFLSAFDTFASRTILPIVTLLLGYLFGKSKR